MKKSLLPCAVLFAVWATPVLAAPPFEQLDVNSDKTISQKESEGWRPLVRVFDTLDKNCDGKLQVIEYGYMLTGKKAPEKCAGKTSSVVKIK